MTPQQHRILIEEIKTHTAGAEQEGELMPQEFREMTVQ